MVFASEVERDAMVSNFQLLIESLRNRADKQGIGHFGIKLHQPPRCMTDVVVTAMFKRQLENGIAVTKYCSNGTAQPRFLWLSQGRLRVTKKMSTSSIITSRSRSRPAGSRIHSRRDKGIDLDDVFEIRPGVFSHSFTQTVDTNDTLKAETAVLDATCFSIIATERTLDMCVQTRSERDQLVTRFRTFCRYFNSDPEAAEALSK